MRDYAYYETGKSFAPQPGAIYENENGEQYICLNYSLYVNRYDHAEVLPVMQRVTDHHENWTLFAHDIKQYEDGRIAWGFSSEIGFLPREPYNGALESVNRKLNSHNVWVVTRSCTCYSVANDELGIMEEKTTEIVGVYDSEEKAREKQESEINWSHLFEMEFGCDPVDVMVSELEIE